MEESVKTGFLRELKCFGRSDDFYREGKRSSLFSKKMKKLTKNRAIFCAGYHKKSVNLGDISLKLSLFCRQNFIRSYLRNKQKCSKKT